MLLRYILGIICFSLFFSNFGEAYIPPSDFIVKNIASKRKRFKSLRITRLVHAVQDGEPSGVYFKDVTTYDIISKTLQAHFSNPSGEKIFTLQRRLDSSGAVGLIDGRPVGQLSPPENFLLLEENSDALTYFLLKLNLPIRVEGELGVMTDEETRRASEVTSLKKWDNSYHWVIGKMPQLWVQKDAFLPTRFLWNSGRSESGNQMELQFKSYRIVSGFHFPAEVLLLSQEQLTLKTQTLGVEVNPDLSKASMNLKSDFTSVEISSSSPLKEAVQNYVQFVR